MVRYRRDEDAIADAIRDTRRGLRDVQRPTGTERRLTADTADAALDLAEQVSDNPVLSQAVPKAPTGLVEVSNVGSFTSAGPVASVTLDWDAVTESTDGDPITVSEYEVRDGAAALTRVTAPSVVLSVPSGVSRSLRVVALTAASVRSDPSTVLSVTGADPTVSTRAPSVPTLMSSSGVVVARWDGSYTGSGSGAHTVWVEARVGVNGWVRQGAALTGAGSQLVRLGVVGDTVDVRLVAYDQLGRETGISGIASVEISGIDGADIQAGTIEGNRIVAGSIAVDLLEPNVGEQLNLVANEAIQFIVGRQGDQDTAISHAQETADGAQSDATSAGVQAGNAAADAAIAAGQALVAQSMASVADAKATDLGTVLRLTTDGLILGRPDASAELRLTPEAVEIVQGGVAASRWEAGRMAVNEILVNRGQLANHIIEKQGTTRSVFKPIE